MSTKKNGFVGPHPWQLARDLYARITYSDPEPRRRDKCCWMFKGSRTYGMLHFRGRSYRATHVSFELAVGELIPPDLLLRHTCDNPPCVNPAHLLTGTNLDNKRDEMSRKRTAVGLRNGAYTKPENRPRGIRHRGSTISPETAALIKGCLIRMGRKPGTLASIAAFYRTSYGVVTGIAYRKSWVPVEATEPSVLPPLLLRQ